MVARRATVTEADMRRAIKVATECGLNVRECVMNPTEVRLVFSNAEEKLEPANNLKPKEWPRWQG